MERDDFVELGADPRIAAMWRRAAKKVSDALMNGEAPRFSVDKLNEFEKLFLDDNGEVTDLDLEQFIAKFSAYLGGHYHRSQWLKLFVDIDADRGGTVSWDEFTTFMVHQSVGLVAEYGRAKEFVPLPPPKIQNAHKEPAAHFVSLGWTGCYASAGTDGTVRVWGSDLLHLKTIANSKLAASAELASYAATVPISDMTASGSVCCVATVDKCLNLYHAETMQLSKRYIGRNLFNDISIPPMYLSTSAKPIDTCILMGMGDGLSSAEFHQLPSGRELFFTGHMDGSLLVYPAHRLSLTPEIKPLVVATAIHSGSITRVRFQPSFNSILSSGWDRSICVTDVETGVVTTRFAGVAPTDKTTVGHAKAVTNFAYHESSKLLASISSERDICLWNPSMAAAVQKLPGHTGSLLSVCFNDSEGQMLSLSSDNMIKIWDMRTFRTFQTIVLTSPLKMSTLCFDDLTGRMIALASVPHAWCLRRVHCGFAATYRGHIEPVVGVLYHKDLDVVVTTDQCSHMTWDVRNGARLLVWEGARDPQYFAATCLDYSGRRLVAVTKDGVVRIYNHRSGQLLREEKVSGVDDVLGSHFLVKLPNHVYLAVVSMYKVSFLKELADNDFQHFDVSLAGWQATCAEVGSIDVYGVPTLSIGTSAGGILSVSATQRAIVGACPPPPPLARDPLQEFAGAVIQKQVEGITAFIIKGFVVSVCGDALVYLWSVGKAPLLLFSTELSECSAQLVAVAHNTAETILFLGDEAGAVHLYNVERVPVNRKGTRYRSGHFEYLLCCETHACPIVKIVVMSHRKLFAVSGSDLKIKLVDFDGRMVGTFGEGSWNCPRPSKLFTDRDALRRPTCFRASAGVFLTASTTSAARATIDVARGVGIREAPAAAVLPLVSVVPTHDEGRISRAASTPPYSKSLREALHGVHGRALTPALGHRMREGIVRSSPAVSREGAGTLQRSQSSLQAHFPPETSGYGVGSQMFDGDLTIRERSRSPTRWPAVELEPETLLSDPLVSLKQSFETSRSQSREWARCTPDFTTCRAEQRSETSRMIFDARRKNPTGWSSLTISSFLPVQVVPTTVLEAPRGSQRKLPPLGSRRQ